MAMFLESVEREERALEDAQKVRARLTWRATTPLRSEFVAQLLKRLPRPLRRGGPPPPQPDTRQQWRASTEYWDAIRALRASVADVSVGVIVHIHYPELWPSIYQAIQGMGVDARVLVTVTPHAASEVRAMTGRDIDVVEVPNVGRDMGAFFAALEVIADRDDWRGSDAILRLHGKRSPHLASGDAWRRDSVNTLTRSMPAVVRVMREDPRVGVAAITRSPWLNPTLEASRSGFRTAWEAPDGFDWREFRHEPFPVGGMFWFRPELIEEYRMLGVMQRCFDLDDPTATDNETPHLLERVVGWWPRYRGYQIMDAASVTDQLVLRARFEESPDHAVRLLSELRALVTTPATST